MELIPRSLPGRGLAHLVLVHRLSTLALPVRGGGGGIFGDVSAAVEASA